MDYIGFFSGGGIKGLAYIGCIIALEERGIFCRRCAGTSVGAIFASLLASGYHGKELLHIVYKTDFQKLFKNNTFKDKVKKLGLTSTKELEQYLNNLYLKKNVRTFKDLYYNNDYKLKVIATDLKKLKKLILPMDLIDYNINPNHYLVSKAVVMSSSLPFFFEPFKINSDLIVDGGLKENIPQVSFLENLPKIYFVFKEKENLDGYVIKIDLPKIKTTDFFISQEKIKELIRCGYESTINFIKDNLFK